MHGSELPARASVWNHGRGSLAALVMEGEAVDRSNGGAPVADALYRVVEAGERAVERGQFGQRGLGAGHVAQGDGAMQPGDRGRCVAQQHVIKDHDLRPVSVGLQLVRAGSMVAGGAGEELGGGGDRVVVPQVAVLVL